MTIDRHKLRGIYARLKGIQRSDLRGICAATIGRDFNKLTAQAGEILGEPTEDFQVPHSAFRQNGYCSAEEVVNKLNQLVSYLEPTTSGPKSSRSDQSTIRSKMNSSKRVALTSSPHQPTLIE
jgi:hypothetical protein